MKRTPINPASWSLKLGFEQSRHLFPITDRNLVTAISLSSAALVKGSHPPPVAMGLSRP
jgi:hypothetical protein